MRYSSRARTLKGTDWGIYHCQWVEARDDEYDDRRFAGKLPAKLES